MPLRVVMTARVLSHPEVVLVDQLPLQRVDRHAVRAPEIDDDRVPVGQRRGGLGERMVERGRGIQHQLRVYVLRELDNARQTRRGEGPCLHIDWRTRNLLARLWLPWTGATAAFSFTLFAALW